MDVSHNQFQNFEGFETFLNFVVKPLQLICFGFHSIFCSYYSIVAPATGLAFSPLNEMLLLSCGLDKRIVCYDVQGKKYVEKCLLSKKEKKKPHKTKNQTNFAVKE